MPVTAMDARRTQGTFQRTLNGQQPASWQARHAASRPPGTSPLRIANSPAQLLTLACLLGSLPRAGTGTGMSQDATPHRPDTSSALLPGTAATPPRYTVIASEAATPSLTTRLAGIANMVAGTCMSHPRACKAALGTGALLGVGAITASAVHAMTPHTPAEKQQVSLPDVADQVSSRQTTSTTPPTTAGRRLKPRVTLADEIRNLINDMHVIDAHGDTPRRLEAALVAAVVMCAGSNACVRDQFERLLDGLSHTDQQRLEDYVDYFSNSAPTPLPDAEAQPLQPGTRKALAKMLVHIYPLDQATYLNDVEHLVDATCGRADPDKAPCQSMTGDNDARLHMIQRLFEQAGHTVQVEPYQIAEADAATLHIPTDGHNLLVSIDGAHAASGSAQRTLMLVAHGDMTGAGSSGAYDNGSGVALLLHIARWITGVRLPTGTRVQLLVTSKEELGLLGAEAFAATCLRQNTCPTLVLNIDLIGRGGRGYLVSTSDTIDRFFLNVDPMQPPTAGVVSAEEAAGAKMLHATLASRGFTRHLEHAPYLLLSDHVAFQRRGIAALGITQIDEADALASKVEQDADVQRRAAWRQVNWTELEALEERLPGALTPNESARFNTLLDAAVIYDDANDVYEAAMAALPADAQSRVIHGSRDQTRSLDAADAVAFCEAIQAFVTWWVSSARST